MIIYQGNISHINTPENPKIISLVPSLTHYILDLKLNNNLKGITKYCDTKPFEPCSAIRLNGTKDPDILRISHIAPDLIITNKEENRKEDIEILARDHMVYVSDVRDIPSMFEMMSDIAYLTHKEEEAGYFILEIQKELEQFQRTLGEKSKQRVCYLIWRKPYMSVGSDTFIHSMLELAGFENIFKTERRYPETNLNEIIAKKGDVILLSSEPFPFRSKHIEELKPVPAYLVDGKMFSWYGSFMIRSFKYLKALKSEVNNTI